MGKQTSAGVFKFDTSLAQLLSDPVHKCIKCKTRMEKCSSFAGEYTVYIWACRACKPLCFVRV